MIYIATDIHGRGIKYINAFDSKLDFWAYADEVLSCRDAHPKRSDTIDTLCEHLYDSGFGFGARSHHRVSRLDAAQLIRNGAKGCLLSTDTMRAISLPCK
tara:strand:- start:694 stop:993 length:300 start_codon:yes stop_codon:yes gene_type:complete